MPKQPNQASKPPVGSDDSAYNHDRPPTWKPVKPAFMYVHYLRKDTDPIKVYLFQISQPQNGLSRDDVSRAISAIQSNSVPSITKGDRGIEWRALSYMVFVLGETTEAFMQEGIKFQCEDSMKNF